MLYLDSSAVVKLVVRERETDELRAFIGGADLVSSEIAEVEVPRAAYLTTENAETLAHAEAILRRFSLVALDDELRHEAARARPPALRSLDAVHLVSCLRLARELTAVVVYDRRLTAALRALGLPIAAPAPGRV